MKFLREIPLEKITNEVMALEQEGFTLIYKNDSVEIWYDVKPLGNAMNKQEALV
jgi:hypothetical protein